MRFLVLPLLFFWSWFFSSDQNSSEEGMTSAKVQIMPEICDNGIDDDMDGLIDLNDTLDCQCDGLKNVVFKPSSLIPNPSFEDTLCCPNGLAQLDCAANWIQASRATSDFFHTCGYPFNAERGRPPAPLPDGEAYVGFLDLPGFLGRLYKEYVGACLNEPMLAGQTYTMQFYLGFGRAGTIYSARSPFEIVLWGTTNCAELPFGGRNFQTCPNGIGDWREIASVVLRGSNEWVQGTITFTPTEDIEAVVLGPGCLPNIPGGYYFLDDLVLNESSIFNTVPLSLQGEVCDEFITLTSDTLSGINYQWYKDGIAIQGANDPSLTISNQEPGTYQLRVDDGTDCQLTQTFDFFPEVDITIIDTLFCAGETITLEGQSITDNLVDTFNFPSSNFCDSIIIVRAQMIDTSSTIIDSIICSGRAVIIGNESFDSAGTYKIQLQNNAGCDSLVNLNLAIEDTLFMRSDTAICAGQTIQYLGRTLNTNESYIFDYSDAQNCNVRETIQVNPLDTFRIVIDTTICRGQPLVSNGNPIEVASDYIFNLNSTEGCDSTVIYRTSILPTYTRMVDTFFCEGDFVILEGDQISVAGNYPYSLTSSLGCDSSITYRVTERQEVFQRLDTGICGGERIIILGDTITMAGTYTLSQDVSGCDSTIELRLTILDDYDIDVDSIICAGASVNWFGDVIFEEGDYPVQLLTVAGCDSVRTLRLQVEEEPEYQAVIIQSILCEDGSNGSVRINSDNSNAQVTWLDGATGSIRDNLSAGTYYYTINYGPECSILDSIELINPEGLKLSVTSLDIACEEERGGSILFDTIEGGTGPLNVYVNGELISPFRGEVNDLEAGNYVVRVVDENGCDIEVNTSVVQPLPIQLRIEASAEEVVLGDSVLLSAISPEINRLNILEWSGPDGLCSDCSLWRVSPPEGESEYVFYAEDDNGCIYELFIQLKAVKAVFIPNVFSPNGDFINDFFNLFDNGSVDAITRFDVYDRWGELVYSNSNIEPSSIDQGWDGTFNGRNALPGVYVYFIEWRDRAGNNENASGDVTLMR